MFGSIVLALAVSAGPAVSVQFEGTLKEALKEIATKGHLNVLVAGDLTEHVQVNLADVSADEAIESVAKVYGLELTREGKMLILRPGAVTKAAPAVAPVPNADQGPVGASDIAAKADAARMTAEQLRARAEADRDRAETIRDSVENLKEAERDRAEALKEAAKAQVEAAKAQAAADKARNGTDLDVVSTGGPVTVTANTRVDTAVAYGGSVNLEENAVVEGDAVAMGGDVVLGKNAEVEGDAVAMGGHVILGEGARVHGKQVSLGGSSLGTAMARSALKSGAALPHKTSVTERLDATDEKAPDRMSLAGFLVNFAFLFGVGFLMLVFAPQRMKNIETTLRSQPVLNGIIGLGALLLGIPVTVILCVTIIGIPIAVIGWLLVALSVPVAIAAVANQIGGAVPTGRVRKTQALVLAVGLLIVMVGLQIPYLGPLLLGAAIMAGLGALLRSRFGAPPKGSPVIDSGGFIDSAPAL